MGEREGETVGVVGAGIVGVSAAIWLQRLGFRVLLVDRTGPGEATSHGNGGVLASCAVVPVTVPGIVRRAPRMLLDRNQPLFLRWSYLPRLAPWLRRYLSHANDADARRTARALEPILADSLEQHQALANGTAAARWIVPCDYLYLYADRAAFLADAYGWRIRRELGFTWDELGGEALRSREPHISPAHRFAVSLPHHGRIADPGAYVKDLAAHFVAEGGEVLRADVTGFSVSDGRARAIQTSGGDLPVQHCVVTAGVWSKPLMRTLGIDVPIESERGYHVEFIEPNVMPTSPIMVASGKFVMTPMEGRLRCAGTVEFGGLTAGASDAPFELLIRQAKAALPKLEARRIERWMGHRPAPADSIPIIGEVPGAAGVYAGFGHHHVGLTSGAKTGRLIAEALAGRRPNLDLLPYSPARFAA